MKEALKLALEALEEAWYHVGTFQPTEKAIDLYDEARAAIKEALAQPERDYERGFIDGMQKQMQSSVDKAVNRLAKPNREPVALKLMPREATREMLEEMDECSTEGYDERLYAGHAASVYMAAWDAFQPQPEQYITDAMKVRQAVAQALLDDVYAEELEQPEAKQSGTISITMPAPVAYLCENAVGHKYFRWKKPSSTYKPIPLYTTPPQRKPLTKEQRIQIVKDNTIQGYHGDYFDAWGIIDDVEAAHGIKE